MQNTSLLAMLVVACWDAVLLVKCAVIATAGDQERQRKRGMHMRPVSAEPGAPQAGLEVVAADGVDMLNRQPPPVSGWVVSASPGAQDTPVAHRVWRPRLQTRVCC